jgi:hypothetical protein
MNHSIPSTPLSSAGQFSKFVWMTLRAARGGHLRFRVGFRVDVDRCFCALKILQRCRFGDSGCFVEGAMIAPSINDDLLLKEERP